MISEKIGKLRLAYEKERDTLDQNHKKILADLNAQLASVKAKDYYKPYKDQYESLGKAMEAYYQKILAIEKNTHGLAFYTDKYLPTAAPLPFGQNNVEQMFETVAEQCRSTVQALSASHTVNEYAGLLKTYCNLLTTMRHIVKNSTELLRKSGIPDAKKRKDTDDLAAKINRENQTYQIASKLESLKCYASIIALQNELNLAYETYAQERLGAVSLGDDEQYTYLVGYRIEKADPRDIDFCETVVGVGREKINRSPIYLKACTRQCNLIINAPGEFLASPACYEMMRNIYFSVASRVDKNMLQFGCIECTDNRAVARSIYTGIDTGGEKKRLGGDGAFTYADINTNKAAKVDACLSRINDDCCQSVDAYGNLATYNRQTEKNKQPVKMVAINLYPAGFCHSHRDEQPASKLRQLMKEFWDSGTFFVVCQDTSHPSLNAEGIRLDAQFCNAVEITLSESSYRTWKASGAPLKQCEFTIDGTPATLDITAPGFNGEAYWDALKKYYSTKKIFALQSVFKKTALAIGDMQHRPSLFDEGVLDVPLGLKGSEPYSLRYPLTQAAHTMIFGGSGSGKSSFLHTFILSLCYKYSPEDVQIYLADFKLSLQQFYVENKLPHVKYILTKNGATEIKDTFTMIEEIRNERQKMFGSGDIISYNQAAARCTNGSMKKLPLLLFIIDEYQVIQEVSGANSRDMQFISSKINTIISQARSAGIILFLCGQNFSDIGNFDTGNLSTYVIMGNQVDNQRLIQKYLLKNDFSHDMTSLNDFLSVKEDGRCLIKSAETVSADKVRFAFPGTEESGQKQAYVQEILALPGNCTKKRTSIIMGGSEEPICVTEYPDYQEDLLHDGDTSYRLSVGIKSTTGHPTYMDFASEGLNFGWLVCASKSACSNNITRSAMLSFLYKTLQLGYDYSEQKLDKRIHYWGDMFNYRNLLGDKFFGKNKPEIIDEQVSMKRTNKEAYRIFEDMIELEEEMQRRLDDMDDMGVRFSETTDYPPYLIVLQSTKWLHENVISDVIREHQNQATKDTAAYAEQVSSAVDESDEISSEHAVNLKFFGKAMAAHHVKAAGSRRSTRSISSDDVLNAFRNLFRDGNKCGIFMLLVIEKQSELSDVFDRRDYSDGAYRNHTIYGSFAEYEDELDNLMLNGQEQDMICYVGSDGVKTRLFDYNPNTESEWWNEIQNML